MKKFLLPPLVIHSHLLFAGGFSGGGPPPVMSHEEILMLMQPDLGLENIQVPVDDFRRARMRISVKNETDMNISGETIMVKEKLGGMTDIAESRQMVPVK